MESVVEVLAEVHLFSAAVGGKTHGYASAAMPNHFFPGQASSVLGDMRFEDQDELLPGAFATARVRLLYPDTFPELTVGTTWRLQEGTRYVGSAKVLKILNARP